MAFAVTIAISCKDNNAEGTDVESTEINAESTEEVAENKSITVPMQSKSGSNVTGSIAFTESEGTVQMTVNLTGLTPGAHAIHLHENGDCSADDGSSAGGHWNPNAKEHGSWADGTNHMGDIGNLEAGDDGTATLTFSTDEWCIGCDDDSKNIVGKGVIVHASADDFESQPSGAAGAREACGVIE